MDMNYLTTLGKAEVHPKMEKVIPSVFTREQKLAHLNLYIELNETSLVTLKMFDEQNGFPKGTSANFARFLREGKLGADFAPMVSELYRIKILAVFFVAAISAAFS